LRTEEHAFWARHTPGLRGLSDADRAKETDRLKRSRPDLLKAWQAEASNFERQRNAVRHLPGMNTGHPDLFRAFLWRFIALCREGSGRIGIVLPGDALKIKGAEKLRRLLL